MSNSLTEPLTPGQQMLLQRLMAAHVLAHDECVAIFKSVNDTRNCDTLEKCFRAINEQLMAGFGLEIATTVMKGGMKFHAVINPHAEDDIARASFTSTLPPSEREYVRKVLEKLVQCGNDDDDSDDDGVSDGSATRMDLINLRNSLDTKYRMNVQETEHCLDRLMNERWLCIDGAGDRRASMKTTYAIGPRTYLELRHLLTDFGLEDLPQCIYHRAV